MRDIQDEEWNRFLDHNNKRKHCTELVKSRKACNSEKAWAKEELYRHSFGLQRKGIVYIPTFAMRVALRVLHQSIGWWGEELHCIVCGTTRSIACSACGAAVCCTHRMMGGEKPKDWPVALGGMYIYCLDGTACEERWLQLHYHCQ